MKKRTKSQRRRQPRSPRMSRQRSSRPEAGIIELRREIREGLVGEIRSAMTKTAHQLVEDEVLALVGEPWSRKGDSTLRRNGKPYVGVNVILIRPEIREGTASAMLFWLDVFDTVWNVRIFFGKAAVLTPTVGALPDPTTGARVHQAESLPLS